MLYTASYLAEELRQQIYKVPDLAELPEPPAPTRVEQVRGYCHAPIILDAELIGLLGLG